MKEGLSRERKDERAFLAEITPWLEGRKQHGAHGPCRPSGWLEQGLELWDHVAQNIEFRAEIINLALALGMLNASETSRWRWGIRGSLAYRRYGI